MKTNQLTCRWLPAALAGALLLPMQAAVIVNGGFESGFAGWTRVNQFGSEGTFQLQTGIVSPVNNFPVPAPPSGTAAMTDAAGPGSHVLYQDFVVPVSFTGYSVGFSLFINNGALDFFTPSTLDFSTPALNQRARVDIVKTSADPFSLAAGDILQNLFETTPGSPLVSGYNNLQVDTTTLFQANQGATLRLRFAEIDNVAPFNLGVDNVDIQLSTSVPDTLPWLMQWVTVGGVVVVGAVRRRRDRIGNTRR